MSQPMAAAKRSLIAESSITPSAAKLPKDFKTSMT
jgi:hypothetical protein